MICQTIWPKIFVGPSANRAGTKCSRDPGFVADNLELASSDAASELTNAGQVLDANGMSAPDTVAIGESYLISDELT